LKGANGPVASEMFYEKRVKSLGGLMREISVMDADAGIRVVGRYGGHNCYCFLTRFGGVYTALIYSRSARRKAPGRLLSSIELKSPQQIRQLLLDVTGKKVIAFAY